MKFVILLALTIVGVAAQEGGAPVNSEAAPEPYSYAYQTDTHAASEQRDPSGKVSGFYTLVDADGRERRVEYIADEAGFRAKVATNEVGTRSSNPADVEVVASEPTPAQFAAVVEQSPQPQVVRQQYVQQQYAVQQPARSVQYKYVQQPQQINYGYYPVNAGYGNAVYGYGSGLRYGVNGYGLNGYNQAGYGSNGYGIYSVGNYNNHLPSQYYRSLGQTTTYATGNAPVLGSGAVRYSDVSALGGAGVRYVSQPVGSVTTAGVRSIGVPQTVSYGVPAGVRSSTSSSSSSNLLGSSNYLVIQKRDAKADKTETTN